MDLVWGPLGEDFWRRGCDAINGVKAFQTQRTVWAKAQRNGGVNWGYVGQCCSCVNLRVV